MIGLLKFKLEDDPRLSLRNQVVQGLHQQGLNSIIVAEQTENAASIEKVLIDNHVRRGLSVELYTFEIQSFDALLDKPQVLVGTRATVYDMGGSEIIVIPIPYSTERGVGFDFNQRNSIRLMNEALEGAGQKIATDPAILKALRSE